MTSKSSTLVIVGQKKALILVGVKDALDRITAGQIYQQRALISPRRRGSFVAHLANAHVDDSSAATLNLLTQVRVIVSLATVDSRKTDQSLELLLLRSLISSSDTMLRNDAQLTLAQFTHSDHFRPNLATLGPRTERFKTAVFIYRASGSHSLIAFHSWPQCHVFVRSLITCELFTS